MRNNHSRLLKTTITATCLAVGSANAASVLWVTEHNELIEDWNTLLTGAGYTVTTYLNADDNPNPDAVGAPFSINDLNSFDLIIAAGSNDGSGISDFSDEWAQVTAPLIHMGAFGVRNDWNWFTAHENPAGTISTSYDATDPIFGSIDPTVTPLFSSNPRITNDDIQEGGTILASDDNGTQIARWSAGQVADGPRAFFAGPVGNQTGQRDQLALTAEGQTVFLNLANEFSGIPEPSPALFGGLALLVFLRRRRR